MRVKFIHQQGDEKFLQELRIAGHNKNTKFPVIFNNEYIVYGISLWKGVLEYLVVSDEINRPDWIPAFLFEIIDNKCPSNWLFSYRRDKHSIGLEAIWGYKEMVSNTNHHDDLIERTTEALALFEKRRKEIDENYL